MGGFSELIRNFDKIRDYMRDFYIYGFKTRSEFQHKSARSYDNEKRRIESYLGEYMQWSYGSNGKATVISLDSSEIRTNPLYAAWKSKSFTSNDILLHFYLLDQLQQESPLTVQELTERISQQSGIIFDAQTVRMKCVEYEQEGLFYREKRGKTVYYGLSELYFSHLVALAPGLMDGVKFFHEVGLFGEVGSFLLDQEGETNELFSFKHHYIVHTLEDGILLQLQKALQEGLLVRLKNVSEKTGKTSLTEGVPLKILISAATGRRYVCCYVPSRRRFSCFRLDQIKSVQLLEPYGESEVLKEKLKKNLEYIWGTSLGGRNRRDTLKMKLLIDEATEAYILRRIEREGRGGTLEKVGPNTFLYTRECFDAAEMLPWIKTFTGRILALESNNTEVVSRFHRDTAYLYEMYCGDE